MPATTSIQVYGVKAALKELQKTNPTLRREFLKKYNNRHTDSHFPLEVVIVNIGNKQLEWFCNINLGLRELQNLCGMVGQDEVEIILFRF
jgi:hypothetical protein